MENVGISKTLVAPARERGLKYVVIHSGLKLQERGLKLILYLFAIYPENRRSREGAWIEIKREIGHQMRVMVAPVRERGLKLTRLASS